MVFKRQKSTICLLAAVNLLLLGICLELNQASSSFECTSQNHVELPFLSSLSSIHEKLCTSEMLGQSEVIQGSIIPEDMNYRSSSSDYKIDPHYFFGLPISEASIYYRALHKIREKVQSNAVIVNFIHKKDGKKFIRWAV